MDGACAQRTFCSYVMADRNTPTHKAIDARLPQGLTADVLQEIDGRIFTEASSHRSSQARARVIATPHEIEP